MRPIAVSLSRPYGCLRRLKGQLASWDPQLATECPHVDMAEFDDHDVVERGGLEPPTSAVRGQRSPS